MTVDRGVILNYRYEMVLLLDFTAYICVHPRLSAVLMDKCLSFIIYFYSHGRATTTSTNTLGRRPHAEHLDAGCGVEQEGWPGVKKGMGACTL